MTHKSSCVAACGAALMAVLGLTSCGGGGGEAPITLGGQVYGLVPGSPLELQLVGTSTTGAVQTTSYSPASTPFAVGGSYAKGTSYALSITRHPQGQLCRIVRNASGQLNAAQADVAIECHRTLLNDTGIRSSDPALNLSPALAPDAGVGRDAEADRLTKLGAGAFGFDFTRLCRSGSVVATDGSCPSGTSYGANNDWACTRDNVTGLVWLVQTQAYDLRATPADGLCGQAGWRSPKVRELLSLVHAGRADPGEPAIDLEQFPGTPAGAFRADEVYQDADAAPWIVHFGQRGAAVKHVLGDPVDQRWVASAGASSLVDTPSVDYSRSDVGADYAVVDMKRELMWLVPKSPSAMDWATAVSAVAGVNDAQAGGHADWRLPNRAELESLVQRTRALPALDPKVYGTDTVGFSQVFWTASPGMARQGLDTAWVVDFSRGDISLALKTGAARVMFVRNRVFNSPL